MNAHDIPSDGAFDNGHDPGKFDWALAFFALAGFFSAVFWLGVLGQLILYVPHSHQVFDDFRMKLPHATVLVIRHFWWIVPMSIVATVSACLVIRNRWAWFLPAIALPMVLNVIIFISMYWPQQMLLEALAR